MHFLLVCLCWRAWLPFAPILRICIGMVLENSLPFNEINFEKHQFTVLPGIK
jgi:hypothetical protein